jgi:hypothetical protein
VNLEDARMGCDCIVWKQTTHEFVLWCEGSEGAGLAKYAGLPTGSSVIESSE